MASQKWALKLPWERFIHPRTDSDFNTQLYETSSPIVCRPRRRFRRIFALTGVPIAIRYIRLLCDGLYTVVVVIRQADSRNRAWAVEPPQIPPPSRFPTAGHPALPGHSPLSAREPRACCNNSYSRRKTRNAATIHFDRRRTRKKTPTRTHRRTRRTVSMSIRTLRRAAQLHEFRSSIITFVWCQGNTEGDISLRLAAPTK